MLSSSAEKLQEGVASSRRLPRAVARSAIG
jgi:hypothetical protein